MYLGDDKALSAVGGDGSQSYGNERDNYQALFADVNKRGGLGGQQVRGDFYAISSTETSSSADVQQRICAHFTQDVKVAIVVSTLSALVGDPLRTCLRKAGVGLVSNSLTSGDAQTFRTFPHYVEPSALRVDRIAAALPAGLAASGFFTKGAKVGVLTIKRPTFQRATDDVLVPALRRLGFKPEVARITDPEADAAGSGSDTSSAVLKFKSAGVTHVLLLSPNGTIALLFTNQAESQLYRPAYGFTSQDAIEGLVEGGFIQNPSQQLAKAAGVGWQPWLDVALSDNPLQSRATRCFDVLRKAGASYTASAARWHAALGCDTVSLLEDVARTSSAPFSTPALFRALPLLGAHHRSLATFAADFGSRRDGAAAVRYFAYNASCGCFRYSGGDLSVS
jgi:hypothetical protein